MEGIVQGENFETMAEVEARLIKEGKTFIENKNQYWEQTDKGSKGAEVQMGFDVKQNKTV